MWILALKWPPYVDATVEVVLARHLRAIPVISRVTINLQGASVCVELWRSAPALQISRLKLPAAQISLLQLCATNDTAMSLLSKSGTSLPAKRKPVTVLGNGRAIQHGLDRSSNSVRCPINIVHPFSTNGFPISRQLMRAAGRTSDLVYVRPPEMSAI